MMTEKNKMECDDLLKTHEMTQKLLDANTADAAMLATLLGRSAHARRGPSFCQYTSCTNFSINLCAI